MAAAQMGRSYRSTHAPATQTFGSNSTHQFFFGSDQAQDARGRLIERLDGERDTRETFQYDSLGRLVDYKRITVNPACPPTVPSDEFGAPCTGGTQTLLEQRGYGYDVVGNLAGTGIIVDSGNRMRTAYGYSFDYDADGNLIRKYKTADPSEFDQYLWWNSIGELDSAWTTRSGVTQKARYGYDGFGRRVRRDVDGQVTRYIYRGQQIAAELNGAGAVLRRYTYYPGTDRPHSLELATGEIYFYVSDHQGNIEGLVAPDGFVESKFRYSPHGELVFSGGDLGDPHRFAAREYDAETGLYYNRARYYDPQVGRFISEDPIGLTGGINLFAYAANDPVNLQDPSGLCSEEAGGWDKIVYTQNDEGEWIANCYVMNSYGYWKSTGMTVFGERDPFRFVVHEIASLTAPMESFANGLGEALGGYDAVRSVDAFRNGELAKGLFLAAMANPFNRGGRAILTTAQATDLARYLGYTRRVKDYPFNSHGQAVFTNGRTYLTQDVDGHGLSTWKVFDRRGRRLGTYDELLNYLRP